MFWALWQLLALLLLWAWRMHDVIRPAANRYAARILAFQEQRPLCERAPLALDVMLPVVAIALLCCSSQRRPQPGLY